MQVTVKMANEQGLKRPISRSKDRSSNQVSVDNSGVFFYAVRTHPGNGRIIDVCATWRGPARATFDEANADLEADQKEKLSSGNDAYRMCSRWAVEARKRGKFD